MTAHDVTCPKCSAHPGEPCKNLRVVFEGRYQLKRRGGTLKEFHIERVRAAKFDTSFTVRPKRLPSRK